MHVFSPQEESLRLFLRMAILLSGVSLGVSPATAVGPGRPTPPRPSPPRGGYRPMTPAQLQMQQKSKAEFDRAVAQQQREFEQKKRQAQSQYERARQQNLPGAGSA